LSRVYIRRFILKMHLCVMFIVYGVVVTVWCCREEELQGRDERDSTRQREAGPPPPPLSSCPAPFFPHAQYRKAVFSLSCLRRSLPPSRKKKKNFAMRPLTLSSSASLPPPPPQATSPTAAAWLRIGPVPALRHGTTARALKLVWPRLPREVLLSLPNTLPETGSLTLVAGRWDETPVAARFKTVFGSPSSSPLSPSSPDPLYNLSLLTPLAAAADGIPLPPPLSPNPAQLLEERADGTKRPLQVWILNLRPTLSLITPNP
jgi:hypothetical protein